VAVAVVYYFEAVEVEIHYGDLFFAPQAAEKFGFQCAVETAAVGQAGEFIDEGETADQIHVVGRAGHYQDHSRDDQDHRSQGNQSLFDSDKPFNYNEFHYPTDLRGHVPECETGKAEGDHGQSHNA